MGATDATVRVVNHFQAVVAGLTGIPEYSPDRTGGTVAGKTITTTEGEVVILLNADAVRELDLPIIERLAAHEAGHLLVTRNDETITWEDTARLQTVGWRRVMTYIAANALDEYRVEAAVVDCGYPAHHDADPTELGWGLMDANAEPLEAFLLFRETNDVAALRDALLAVMDRFTKRLANIAASQRHTPFDPDALDIAARANWDAIVAPVWRKHQSFYAPAPSATVRWDRTALEAHLTEGWLVAVRLLRSLGFEYRGGDDDESFWSVRGEEDLERAFARYQADTAVRAE